ncbi:MAG: hypothetical protein AABX89_04005 [Candidatus Thermoplasmatota archaeon]
MDAASGAVRGATLAIALLACGLLLAATLQPGATAQRPLTTRDGSPLVVPSGSAVVEAAWGGKFVLLFKVEADQMQGSDATATIAAPGEPGLRLFALSAKSTHLGCIVKPAPQALRESFGPDRVARPGLLIDPCHQFLWDAYKDGLEVHGFMPRLAQLDLAVVDGALVATGFDGPVGPQP